MLSIPAKLAESEVYRPLIDLLEDSYLTAAEVGQRLRFHTGYLSNMRRDGNGPPFIKMPSGAVRYPLSGLLAWELQGFSQHINLDRIALAVLAAPTLNDAQKLQITEHLRTALSRASA